MQQIKLLRLTLLNFKGVRNLDLNFAGQDTSICGANGTGKTTIFDAFTWVLFGKDSQDRKNFDIKTLDANGKAIARIPHEVTAVLDVNGETITLCRRFNEKWQKKRGSAVEEFTGHEEERLWNDVPCSTKEWAEKVSALCSEQIFKFITSPSYFVSQKTEVQRNMLFRMAGNVSDEEIADGNEEFTALLNELCGKTAEEYKREISAKKRRVKEELDAIPERISERQRDIPESIDFKAAEAELKRLQKSLEEVETELATRVEQINKQNAQREAELKERNAQREQQIRELATLKEQKLTLEHQIKETVTQDYNQTLRNQSDLKAQVDTLKNDIQNDTANLEKAQQYLSQYQAEREELIKEWHAINAETLTFDEKDFICPTCKRHFDVVEIEAKQREMEQNFQTNKLARIDANVSKGKETKTKIDYFNGFIEATNKAIAEKTAKMQEIIGSELYNISPVMPDVTPAIDGNLEHQDLCARIAEVEALLAGTATAQNTTEATIEPAQDASDIRARRTELTAQIDAQKAILNTKELIKRNNARIAELETQQRTLAQELADLEKKEFTMAAFSKARIDALEDKINGLFSIVKFRMFEQQLNGGEVETCEATVNGVPYSSQNNAMQVNMGIDIINAITKFEGITAPIFFDNAESVNTLLPTTAQVIRLVVTTGELHIQKTQPQQELFN